jgi:hypothetical protein
VIEAQTAEASGITALMLLGVLLIPWLTLAISEVLLALYRRAVVRAMRGQQSPRSPSPGPLEQPTTALGRVALLIRSADTESRDAGSATGGVLLDRFRRSIKATVAVYITAGLVYAGVMAIVMGVQSRTLSAGSWLAYTVGFAWPVVLTALLVDPPRRRRWQAAVVIAYFAIFLLGTLVPPIRWNLLGIFVANGAATFVALVVRANRIHAVAPLIGAVLTIVGAALLFTVALASSFEDSRAPGTPSALDNAGIAFLFLAIVAGLLAAGPLTGWVMLRAVAARYGRKRTSDQAIAMFALWLVFAGIQSTTFSFVDARWLAGGVLAFSVFSVMTIAGFWLLRRHRSDDEHGPRLLVLRVFALGRRSRKLFDRFAARWRHIGSIQLIAGPDLASSTVEPHEFLDFLRRRLGDRFLDSNDSIDRTLGQLDTRPDYDGRYRITDFFCRDHAWRTVFGRLAAASDVVLMDLRGFSPINAGCTYEVGELLNVVPSERIAIVIDRLTDEAFLTRTLDEARARLHTNSPNISASELQVRVFRESGRRGFDPDRLLQLLCDAAAPATVAAGL